MWGIYQRIIRAYRHPDRAAGGELMRNVIADLSHDVPAELTELRRLGRTLKHRAEDVLAYFAPTRHEQRPDGGDQWAAGTPVRLRPRLPEPDQLHRPIPPRSRRLQTTTTPSNRMSRFVKSRFAEHHAFLDRGAVSELSSSKNLDPYPRTDAPSSATPSFLNSQLWRSLVLQPRQSATVQGYICSIERFCMCIRTLVHDVGMLIK